MVDFSNIKLDINSMNAFLNDQGVNVKAKDLKKLNTIFKECDTEGAKNEKGENIGDGTLNGQERANFLSKIKSACPKLYDKIEDFFKTVEQEEVNNANQKEIKEEIHKNDNSGTKAENKEIPDTHTTLQKLRKMFNQEMISEEMHIRLDETEAEFEKEAKKLNNILDFNHKFKGEISDDILQKQISTLKSITDEKEFNEKLSEFERDNNRLILQMQKVNEWLNF